jgi:RNA polymerase sigma-70 factor (ECF subfamily)
VIAPELVRQAQRGDQRALGDLLAALRPVLVRYCGRKVGANDAEDVTQDALMCLTNAIKTYRPRKPIEALAFTIAASCASDARRRMYRDRTQPMAEVPETGQVPDAEQLVLRVELAQTLAQHMQNLPPQQREIVLMRVVVGLSACETAGLVDSTPGAVRVAQHRALQRLRTTMAGAL